jgi:(p)ppGpp synthase/HD superfamily hydrolase
MLEKNKKFAINAHENVNHLYGNRPYSFHLNMVVEVAQEFLHHIPEEDRDVVLSACWLHDTIEDCRLTYNDILKVAGLQIAEIVYALSNEKGQTRKERANDKYYQGICETPYARFVKLCDRIANVKHSLTEHSKMFLMYQKENKNFTAQLFKNEIEIKPYEVLALKELQILFEHNPVE